MHAPMAPMAPMPPMVHAPLAPKASGAGAGVAIALVSLLVLLAAGGGAALWLMAPKAAPPPRPSKPAAQTAAVPAVAPTLSASSAPQDSGASERRKAWLTAPLKGHDNVVAALRKATIVEKDGAFRPQELRKCGSREGWGAHNTPENVIKLTCEESATEEACKGSYFLSSPQGFSSKEIMQLVRPK
jgi:hypothetical protein